MNNTATSNSRNENHPGSGDNSLNLVEQFTLLRTNKEATEAVDAEDELTLAPGIGSMHQLTYIQD